MVNIAVSGHHATKDLPPPEDWPINVKIEIFAARVNDWGFDIARKLKDEQHGGYARLSIVLSYFEMMGKYETGYRKDIEDFKNQKSHRSSPDHFWKGVEAVGHFAKWPQQDITKLKDWLWRALRCGLYHSGMSRHGMWVSESLHEVYVFENEDDLFMAPNALVNLLSSHFDDYIAELRQASVEQKERGKRSNRLDKFEKRFDAEITDKVIERLARARSQTKC